MNSSWFFRLILGTVLFCGQAPANENDNDSTDQETFSIVPHGFAGLQSFRISRYKNSGLEYPSQNFNNSVLNFTFDLLSGEHLSIHAGIEGYVTFSTLPYDKLGSVGSTEQAAPLWSWYMANAEIVYSFGEPEDLFHGDMGVGLFPYKYNEEARNLGEYLFRSGTYPGWLLTTFDWTATRLTGARFSSTLFGNWRNDVMLTTEMEWFPFYDLSLTWLSELQIGKVLTLGGGVSAARFLPANDSITTPRITVIGTKQILNHYNKSADTSVYDTAFYTFKGIKAMGRFTFDPKGFFDLDLNKKTFSVGKEDFKVFGEVAVLGVQDQGPLYNNVLQRMPVMFGFNFPTFNLLDVLALQMEYYASPYPNDYANQIRFVSAGVPQPTKGSGYGNPGSKYTTANPNSGQSNFYTQDNWKWSVYGRRWMGKHLAIVAQVANDHWRTSTPYATVRDTEEALSVPSKHWYAALKIVSVW